ncbi:hypothetical protein BB560_000079 [Smittium megazygosporum]|uniref:Uncharacterized protein n=1 Tax=Smittium megazygosporum TaxID=133381 RepID=A0A2T9ZLC7_9FUNG|nr:hypothetical protein BB560_000079 [Smittium megazygosporum]
MLNVPMSAPFNQLRQPQGSGFVPNFGITNPGQMYPRFENVNPFSSLHGANPILSNPDIFKKTLLNPQLNTANIMPNNQPIYPTPNKFMLYQNNQLRVQQQLQKPKPLNVSQPQKPITGSRILENNIMPNTNNLKQNRVVSNTFPLNSQFIEDLISQQSNGTNSIDGSKRIMSETRSNVLQNQSLNFQFNSTNPNDHLNAISHMFANQGQQNLSNQSALNPQFQFPPDLQFQQNNLLQSSEFNIPIPQIQNFVNFQTNFVPSTSFFLNDNINTQPPFKSNVNEYSELKPMQVPKYTDISSAVQNHINSIISDSKYSSPVDNEYKFNIEANVNKRNGPSDHSSDENLIQNNNKTAPEFPRLKKHKSSLNITESATSSLSNQEVHSPETLVGVSVAPATLEENLKASEKQDIEACTNNTNNNNAGVEKNAFPQTNLKQSEETLKNSLENGEKVMLAKSQITEKLQASKSSESLQTKKPENSFEENISLFGFEVLPSDSEKVKSFEGLEGKNILSENAETMIVQPHNMEFFPSSWENNLSNEAEFINSFVDSSGF